MMIKIVVMIMIMNQVYNETCTQDDGYFYGGYTDQEREGEWINIATGDLMTWDNWDEGHPFNYTNYDCVELLVDNDNKFMDFDCSIGYCPICEIKEMRTFQLRGVCLESQVDKYFAMVNTTFFRGYIQSDLIFSTTDKRWEIVKKNNESSVLAYLEEDVYPLGQQPWYFKNGTCKELNISKKLFSSIFSKNFHPYFQNIFNIIFKDPGEEVTRSLNLHLDVPQPGYFCCEDGACISSELVCNNFHDCEDLSDEKDCSLIVFPSHYQNDFPSLQLKNGRKHPLTLEANLTILNIFNIDDVGSTFDLNFLLTVEWFDKDLTFQFLKNSDFENVLSEKYFDRIWRPDIDFDHKVKVINSFQNTIFIRKVGQPTLSGEVDQIELRELYGGAENPLTIIINKRILFSCSFDNINNYPFGSQTCYWEFFLLGAANQLTKAGVKIFH